MKWIYSLFKQKKQFDYFQEISALVSTLKKSAKTQELELQKLTKILIQCLGKNSANIMTPEQEDEYIEAGARLMKELNLKWQYEKTQMRENDLNQQLWEKEQKLKESE